MKTPTPKEIRDRFSEYTDEWKEIRDEADVDMAFYAGDPWTKEDRAKREDAGRPCISLDELSQYINQYNNNLRENKRAIQVIPKGNGADDADATRRENLIRGVENESNAQEAYITMAEDAAARSYGFLLLRTEYYNDAKEDEDPDVSLFDQKIVIKRVADPNTILLNPSYEKADASDVEDGFVLKRIRRKDFARKYPNAKKVSFTSEDIRTAKDWVSEKDLQIAEWWKLHKTPKKCLLLKGPSGPITMWADDLKKFGKPENVEVVDERMVDMKEVIQYLTNGIEIIDETPWAGSRIPIISCFGKELWFDEGGGSKRHLLSMIRLARDPQMLFAYMCTQEAEEAGMTPKTPFIGAKGQFESARQVWEQINKQPYSFVEYDIMLDAATQQQLPPPSRLPWSPNFQAYEIAKDSIRRSIQSAMGISPLPTAAQRDSEKSGIALERISTQESVGSFHFTDNFDRALQNLGWQVNELITPIYDTQREVPIEKGDGTYSTLHVVGVSSHPLGEGQTYDTSTLPEQAQSEHLHTGKGDFDVTISTGPSYQSQREQASEFVDHLIANWQQLGIPAPLAQKILALGVKLKDIGPIGDEIQELLDPPSNMQGFPPAAQAAITQLQAQLSAIQQENQALHMDRAAKVLERQTKLQIKNMEIAADGAADATQHQSDQRIAQIQNDIKVLVALIQAKNQNEVQEQQMYKEFWLENHKAAHEVGLTGMQHNQNMELAQQSAATDAQSQASDQAQEQTMAQQSQSQQDQPNPGT
jgi:hypothetical protein